MVIEDVPASSYIIVKYTNINYNKLKYKVEIRYWTITYQF